MQKKNMSKIIAAVLLVAVLLVGATFAYLSDITNTKTNVFSFSADIKGVLEEPNWPGDQENLPPDPKPIPKDPQIRNTCTEDEYVAIKLTFQTGDGTKLDATQVARLLTIIDIRYGLTALGLPVVSSGVHTDINYGSGNYALNNPATQAANLANILADTTSGYNFGTATNQWTAGTVGVTEDSDTATVYFYYNKIVPAGGSTSPIFNFVNFTNIMTTGTKTDVGTEDDPKLMDDDFLWIRNDPSDAIYPGIGGFKIHLEGAVVQATAFTTPANLADTTNWAPIRAALYSLLA